MRGILGRAAQQRGRCECSDWSDGIPGECSRSNSPRTLLGIYLLFFGLSFTRRAFHLRIQKAQRVTAATPRRTKDSTMAEWVLLARTFASMPKKITRTRKRKHLLSDHPCHQRFICSRSPDPHKFHQLGIPQRQATPPPQQAAGHVQSYKQLTDRWPGP